MVVHHPFASRLDALARWCWWVGLLLAGVGVPLSAVMALSPVAAFWRAWGCVPLLAGVASGVLVVCTASLFWTLSAWFAPRRAKQARALCGLATVTWLLWCVAPPLHVVLAGAASLNTGALSMLSFLVWCRLMALGFRPANSI